MFYFRFLAAWAGFNRTRRRHASSGRSLNSQLREKLRLSATLANVGTATSSGGRPLFEDFSLRIAAGERVGLVGESGSGKSSLFALLQRFFAVQSGRISIDGQDIAEVTQDSLRAAIAVVPQDLSLLHRSVMENIRYGHPMPLIIRCTRQPERRNATS